MRRAWWRVVLPVALTLGGCSRSRPSVQASPPPARPTADSKTPTAFALTSSALIDGQPIPRKYTADGDGSSPPLAWRNAPAGTKEFALVARDPDAPGGTYIHWVLYGVPPDVDKLPENVPATETLPDLRGAKQGTNSASKVGYTPPSPPPGKVHHYVFTLYALDKESGLPAKATESQLVGAVQGHTLGTAELTGTYQR